MLLNEEKEALAMIAASKLTCEIKDGRKQYVLGYWGCQIFQLALFETNRIRIKIWTNFS